MEIIGPMFFCAIFKVKGVSAAQTGTHLVELRGHSSGIISAAFSPDGTRVVSGASDSTVRIRVLLAYGYFPVGKIHSGLTKFRRGKSD